MKIKTSILFLILFFIILPALHTLELDDQKMAAFFNSQVPRLLVENKFAGMVVCLVHNGKIIYSKGFGYSDIKSQVKVDPAKTLFRAGSVSKLFTWTAVMQLVEQGKIDLDKDINIYLGDFRLPDTFPEPITMKHLMSHTPGFEDKVLGLLTKDESKLQSLSRVIKEQKLKRIWPPGRVVSYSNYGASLAGYIVEQISCMPFEEYIETYIFKPLNMNHSTFRQPLPDYLKDYMSKGYRFQKNTLVEEHPEKLQLGFNFVEEHPEKLQLGFNFVEEGFEYLQGTPAGSISTTAHDIARFLLAHLNQGILDENTILKPETVKQMHSTHFKPDPYANGFAHGFIEYDINEQRIIGHDGDTIYFHSSAGIIQEHNFGFFFSTNSDTGMLPVHFLLNDFFKEFFPAPTGSELAIPTSRDLKEYAGNYTATRRSESDLSKIISLFMTSNVKVSKDGKSLDIFNFLTRECVSYVEVKERTFQQIDGYDSFTFLKSNKDTIDAVIYNRLPVITFIRMPAWESPVVIIIIAGLAVLMIFSGIIARPVGLMAFFSKKHKPSGFARWAGYTGSILILLYLVYIVLLVVYFTGDVVFELPCPLLFIVPGILFFINIATIVFCPIAWINNYWTLPGRVYYTCMVVISSAFLWLLYYWKFLFPG